MKEFLTGTTAAVLVIVAIALALNECSARNHQFRLACIQGGGSFVGWGDGSACIGRDGKAVRQ
jgi:hypothetical protein